MNDEHDFQHFVLQPKETKAFEYIYAKDPENARDEDDGFNLVIVNDFVDNSNFKKYYFDEANNINSAGTMVYIEKYVRLEDCKTEIDTSDWKTYKNEEYGFEFNYPNTYTPTEGYKVVHFYGEKLKEEENEPRIFPRFNMEYGGEVVDPLDIHADNNQSFIKRGGSLIPIYGQGIENINCQDIKYLVTSSNGIVKDYYINNPDNTKQLIFQIIYKFIPEDTASSILSSIKFIDEK